MQVEQPGVVLFGEDTLNYAQKFLWIPSKRAIRAGYAGPEWKQDSIGKSSTAFGSFTTALGEGSVAIGTFNRASGAKSMAIGDNSNAKGDGSIALGILATATNSYSVALGANISSGFSSVATGYNSTASAYTSFSAGEFSVASGQRAIAMGTQTLADSYGSFAAGQYNIGGGNKDMWVATDPLFTIGNGSSAGRTNAFEVKKNGHVFAPTLSGFGMMSAMTYNPTTGEIGYDNSSRRYKINIETLQDNWSQMLESRPVSYSRPENPDFMEIGYIAEELDSLGLNNLVGYNQEGLPDYVRYDRVVLYLTEIIKSQQNQISALTQDVRELKSTASTQNGQIQQLIELIKSQDRKVTDGLERKYKNPKTSEIGQ
ncbi:MAG: hypothetical protein KDC53_14190 [Saprospiraceae bacterium]|nr:hypothetical protein [Saprospiraceae bacterium]